MNKPAAWHSWQVKGLSHDWSAESGEKEDSEVGCSED